MDRRVSACLIWRSRPPCFSGSIPVTADIKFTGKLGKCAGRGAAWSMRREADEEVKGHIDHMLLAGLSSPSLAAVLGQYQRRARRFLAWTGIRGAQPGRNKLARKRQNARTRARRPGVVGAASIPLISFFALVSISASSALWSAARGRFLAADNCIARPRWRR